MYLMSVSFFLLNSIYPGTHEAELMDLLGI